MTKNVAYARVTTSKQTTEQQVAALQAAGCAPIFTETMSGKRNDRPQLAAALAELKPGDTLTVWKLGRLGRDALRSPRSRTCTTGASSSARRPMAWTPAPTAGEW
ncbi:recombinase family protein [Candidatus Mycolicibacterium alkanivorans]|uniref:recombinase family protein n=1 Tax=Candidatus Mycolicibacterium alkanivorans TaxID=2954114 RepID=UPI001FAA27AB|nr:recombinase family protein [Candidatus Mycolicibacterium alkanivorans]